MDIKVNSKALSNALSLAIKAVPAKAAIPILSNFSLEASGTCLTVTASDTNISIICAVANEGEGKAIVPANTLLELLRTLPACDITLKTKDASCVVDWGMGNSVLPCFPVEDYPAISRPGTVVLRLSQKDLREALKHTLPCVAKDEIRPAISGIYCDITEAETTFVATDSHILSMYPVKVGRETPVSFIIPSQIASILVNYLSDSGDVAIFCDDGGISFSLGSVIISSRKIVGKFPNYRQVIPKNNNNQALADKTTFLSSVKRVATCSSKATGAIKFTINADTEIKVEAQDLGFNIAATEFIPGTMYQGDALVVAFKAEYLLKGLGMIGSGQLILKLSDAKHAALLLPQDAEADPCTILLMPILAQ